LKIYMFMADGDASLDGGYRGVRIAECYRALGRLHEAKYWYGRAIEENPTVNAPCADDIVALGEITIDHLL
jgi:tetratricopeptide (TPR) repeat protein